MIETPFVFVHVVARLGHVNTAFRNSLAKRPDILIERRGQLAAPIRRDLTPHGGCGAGAESRARLRMHATRRGRFSPHALHFTPVFIGSSAAAALLPRTHRRLCLSQVWQHYSINCKTAQEECCATFRARVSRGDRRRAAAGISRRTAGAAAASRAARRSSPADRAPVRSAGADRATRRPPACR